MYAIADRQRVLTRVADRLTMQENPAAVEGWYGRVSWVRLGLKTLLPTGMCLASSVYLANSVVNGHFADCAGDECPPGWASAFLKTTLAATLFVPSLLACGLGAAYIDDYLETQTDQNVARTISRRRAVALVPPPAPQH